MGLFTYCPKCWPADLVDYTAGHCAVCGTELDHVGPRQHIALLELQRDELAKALGEAHQMLIDHGVLGKHSDGNAHPHLRLVHVKKD
ncbi:hypothetical protein [Halomonas organivorans]|uniref:Putative amidophosphoribosyltransferase n=1 Tax=Halomonas organivorans TaxID=257772 RepID=A0A7W5G7Q6_9GAMM|nr:hypothetical protein [Halomonas organivorans]MBB3142776.1 putative amidophosphoribosyltransferase [Halomonas organivorans]